MATKHWYEDMVRYILSRYPALERHQPVPAKQGTCLVLPPVRHYYRYIYLAKQPRKEAFKYGHGVFQLCEAANDFHQTVGNEFWDPATGHKGAFRTDNPEVLAAFDRTIPLGLEILAPIETPDDLLHYIRECAAGYAANRDGEIWAAAAAGRFDEAMQRLKRRSLVLDSTDNPRARMFDMVQLARLRSALEEGRDAVLALLREMEQHNVQMLKLEAYWQPTPFPFEKT